ncbi:MAG: hypothetical protein ACLP1U_13845 [Terracidiphilus sp.]
MSGRLFSRISLSVLLVSPLNTYGQDLKQLSVLNHFSFKGQAPPSHNLLTLVERQARWDDAGAGDLSLTGSHFNPDGLQLRFVKIDEQVLPGGHGTARYRVFAEGAPENKVYFWGSWPMASELTYDPRDLYVNGQGLLMIHKPKPEQELSFKAADGDEYVITTVTDSAVPTRYLLSSRDRQLMIYGTLVPNPVLMEEHTCRLEARMAQPDASAVLIIVDRFAARAKIPLVLESEGSSASVMMNSNAEGHAVTAVFPYVAGITHGNLKASAEGAGCLPYVVIPWGALPEAAPVSSQPETPKEAEAATPGGTTDSKKEHPKKTLLQRLHKPGE